MVIKKNTQIDFNEKRDKGYTGKILFKIYGIKRPLLRRLVLKSFWHLLGQHHQFYSETLRKIFKQYHDIEIGLYSHGSCFNLGAMPPGTKIGRFCSFAAGVTIVEGNHTTNTVSTHAFFFNSSLGYSTGDFMPHPKLVIGNDVWIGQNAIILPSCSVIEDGAVIGASVVVNKDIPAYSVAVGHPCRIVRKRFPDEKIAEIRASKWWEKNIDELLPELENFQVPLEGDVIR